MALGVVSTSTDRAVVLATSGPLFVIMIHSDFGPDMFAHIREHQFAFARKLPERMSTLTIVDVAEVEIARTIRSRSATLRAGAAYMRDSAPVVRCSAVVFDREGFAGALIRSLVTTVNVLAKSTRPQMVFGEIAAALTWIESCDGASSQRVMDHGALIADIMKLRAEWGAGGSVGARANPNARAARP